MAGTLAIAETSFSRKADACVGNPVWTAIESPQFRPGISRARLLSLINECAGYKPDKRFWNDRKIIICPEKFRDGGKTVFEFEFRNNQLIWYKTYENSERC